ncbi:MAG: thiol:disulfide interchange protein DsbA/DsbL [Gammaproteobacteria bacterium]|nr:thiol:disulfide interchange protein DsbA/DsbL [Gammaproteobacteria bacterium]MCW8972373.1 thiol:disulfide interchange protein DsbA/DsbL [Gammaproteobacteria bacterium]MCW8992623.1 thiol:disulfide interchange protein DsbA/DsbL [Gammaproteobacteria bacterium]MCW9089133.1 thiol:disulfide interchange protein DsbA/DsbL [Gammaproteobacteria bacterium]
MFMASGAAKAEEYTAGKDYQLITPAQPGGSGGKVEVVEMFWYGCPHCYQAEPVIEAWLEEKPAHIEFIRIPAIFNQARWALHARAFYTAELLEIMEAFHKPFFNAIHQSGRRMGDEASIRAFFVELGVDGKRFDETFDSFAVQSKVRRAADLTRKYGLTGVPAIVVNGKYRTGGSDAGTYERMMAIAEALASKEAKVAGR